MIMNFGSRITDRKLANFKRLASESENWLSFVVRLPLSFLFPLTFFMKSGGLALHPVAK